MKILNKKSIVITISLSLILVIAIFAVNSKAAYVSNSLTSRYVYDLDQEDTFKAPLIYDVGYEKKINYEDIFGKFYINPEFNYDLDSKKESMEIKEGYLELYFSEFDLQLGKQKLTWGKSDGLIVTNIVNPRDYTIHPVVEFSDQMQSVNFIKTNFYPQNDNLEMIFVPEFKSAKMDPKLLADNLPEGFTKNNSNKDIESNFENSELFMRYSSLGQNIDYEIMAAYHWNDIPTLHKDFQNKEIKPEHHRLTSIGGSLSTMQGPFVFRGEGIYNSGKYFNVKIDQREMMNYPNIEYPEGVVEKDEFKWMVGVDYNYEGYLFSSQFMQEVILDYNEKIKKDEFSNQMTFLIQKDFLRTKLNTEINFHYNLSDEVLMAKPVLSYDYSDVINLKGGANLNLDGESPKSDVIYFQTEYLF